MILKFFIATSFWWWILIALWHSVIKRRSTYEMFLGIRVLVLIFRRRVYFYWLELVELFILYLGVSLCTLPFYLLPHCFYFVRLFMLGGVFFFFCVSCFKLLIDLWLWVLHYYMTLLCVVWNQDFIFFTCIFFSTHAIMHFV